MYFKMVTTQLNINTRRLVELIGVYLEDKNCCLKFNSWPRVWVSPGMLDIVVKPQVISKWNTSNQELANINLISKRGTEIQIWN